MRLIAAVRLSRLADETTSIETQTRSLEAYAAAHGHTIVAVTEDLDVSGGMPIRKRPGVGPWLAPERLGDWDAIAGYRLDRLFRDHYDFVTFYRDVCEAHGKAIISVTEGIDMSTKLGRMIAGILVQFAEWERTRASERRLDATAALRAAARWHGGTPLYGYRPEPRDGHYILVPDEAQARLVCELAAAVIAGVSVNSLAEDLRARGIPSARHGRWSETSLMRLLRNPGLRGYVTHQGKVVLDEDGHILRREPILDDDTWHALQTALAERGPGPVRRYGTPLLSGVLFCGLCEHPMYPNRYTVHRRGRDEYHAYYRCLKREGACGQNVNAARLDAEVAATLLNAYGGELIPERHLIPGVDNRPRLADLDRLIADLDAAYRSGELPARTYFRQISTLEDERERLAAVPVTIGRIEYKPTKITFAQDWQDRDADGRNRLLRNLGARAVYGDGMLVANLRTIDDLRRAIGAGADSPATA